MQLATRYQILIVQHAPIRCHMEIIRPQMAY